MFQEGYRKHLTCVVVLASVISACGDDSTATTASTATSASIAATTTTAAVTTTTPSGATTEPPATTTTLIPPDGQMILPFVDDFDATTELTPVYFANLFLFEYLEGGILRIIRDPAGGEGGLGMFGVYPRTHGDGIEISLTFRNTTPENGTDRGIVLLADAEITEYVAVTVSPSGGVMIYPVIPGYPSDYVQLDGAAANIADGFNTLTVRLQTGSLTVLLNGADLGGIAGLPVATGLLGVFINTNAAGEAMELDRFSVTAIP